MSELGAESFSQSRILKSSMCNPDIHGFSPAAAHLPSPLSASHHLSFPFLISLLHPLPATHPPLLLTQDSPLPCYHNFLVCVFKAHGHKNCPGLEGSLGRLFPTGVSHYARAPPAPAPGSHFRAAHLPWPRRFSLHPAPASAKP